MEENKNEKSVSSGEKSKRFNFNYNRHYKILFFIPLLILVLSLVYLGAFYSRNGDIIYRDVSLSGGTSITINGEVNQAQLEAPLLEKFPDVSFTILTEITTGKQVGLEIKSSSGSEEMKSAIEEILGYELKEGENSSIASQGTSLSQDFYKQLIIALIISFVLMSIVIFVMFRTFIPSIAVIFAVFANIVMPLALIDFLGIKLSAAGIAAFLMLVGYSVDTDILLTTRALKTRDEPLNTRIFKAFKTGSFMNITALAAVLPAFFIVTGLPDSFRQIFLILSFGLVADLVNTWLTNAGIIKWYCDKHGIQ